MFAILDTMKAFKYILTIVVIIIIVLLFRNRRQTVNPPVSNITNGQMSELCYVWNTEAGDNASLRVQTTADSSALTGSFHWIPAEKDRMVGNFAGTTDTAGSAVVWWDVAAEGTQQTQELRFTYSDTQAAVGFGEMKDRGDGVYVYANPQALSYVPTLSKTDCSDPALK
jgi:hypothetical protein